MNTAIIHLYSTYLEEEIYMQQLEGFMEKGKENLVCCMKKSLYELKQAPNQW